MSETLVRTIKIRQGTAAQVSAYVLASGEFAWATDTEELFIGNGVNAGGAILRPSFSRRVALTATYAVGAADARKTFDATSGTWSLTLGAAATLGSGFAFSIFNSGSGVITIDPNSTETIRDAVSSATTKTLAQGEGAIIMCDSTGWLMMKISAGGFSASTTADALEAAYFAADAGANDTYAATLTPAITAYVTGARYRFKANTANTGAASINFNGLGAKTIKKAAGGITTDLADNDIRSGQWVDVVYDGTNMQMQSTLGNASASSGTVNSGLINQLGYYVAAGTAISGLATANNGVLVTSATGVPSISANLPNGLTFLSASGTANINIDAPTGSPAVAILKINGSQKGVVGVAGAVGNYVAGSAVGDMVANALSGNFLWSRDNGTTLHASITAGGSYVKSIGTTCQIIGDSPTGSGSIAQFQINATGKLFVGAAGVANNYVTGAATDDAFVRVDNGDFLISTSGGGSNIAVRVTKTTGALLAIRPTAGIGYGTGAGGTVTQATSKSTGATLNTVCGAITMNNASLAAATPVSFTLTNSAIAATDVVQAVIKSGATAGAYDLTVDAVAAGSCQITLYNRTAGALGEAVVINFAVTKAVTS
jgi:hypothetical protein